MLVQGYFYRKLAKTWDEVKLLKTGVGLMLIAWGC